ncbi:MAG: HAMP domain-containing protein [Caldilineaceae bacterium]
MFINKHDLTLATIPLVFAAGIAIALGFFLSSTVTDNIDALNRGAAAIAAGQLDTRVAVTGNDEMAELARLQQHGRKPERKQRKLDTLRRNLIAWAGHRSAHAAGVGVPSSRRWPTAWWKTTPPAPAIFRPRSGTSARPCSSTTSSRWPRSMRAA